MSDQTGNQPTAPFQTFVFCFTGIKFDFREELGRKVQSYPPSFHVKVESEVQGTFLFSLHSAALEIRIPILFPIFVTSCFDNFINQKPFDLEKLYLQCSVCPLRGKRLALSGFEIEKLRELERVVTSLGGVCEERFSPLCDYFISTLLAFPSNAGHSKPTLSGSRQGLRLLDPCMFCLSCDFKYQEKALLADKLASLGAKFANEISRSEATHYFLTPAGPTKNEFEEAERIRPELIMVNQAWLEACIKGRKLLPGLDLKRDTNGGMGDFGFWKALQVNNPAAFATSGTQDKPIFRGIYFSVVGIDPNTEEAVVKLVEKRGGEMVDIEAFASPRIFILPYNQHTSIDASIRNSHTTSLVTLAWIERCVQDGKLITPDSCILYSPFSNLLPLPEFTHLSFSVTGLTGVRRTHMSLLVCQLGARYTEQLLSTTTHLICDKFEGPKYEFALKNKIQVVTEAWMLRVAETRTVTHPLVLQALPREHNPGFLQEAKQEGSLTKSRDPKPGRASHKPTAILQDLSLPEDSLTKSKGPMPGRASHKTTTILQDLSLPEDRVVLFFSPTLEGNLVELGYKARKLGAETMESFDPKRITHLVFKGGASNQDFRRAAQYGIKVVSPAWIEKCFEAGRRLDEAEFPVQDQRDGLVRWEPKLARMGDGGHTFVAEAAPELSLSSHRLGANSNPIFPTDVPSQEFYVVDREQAARTRRLMLGMEPIKDLPKCNAAPASPPMRVTRSSLRSANSTLTANPSKPATKRPR
ncbi:hypothetical protein L0F63_003804 [Massospora cicadina]|nr:hypothetical protein L0F63_003804 [Massospora cicadina]